MYQSDTNKLLYKILQELENINNKLSDPKEEIQYHIDSTRMVQKHLSDNEIHTKLDKE
jgi:multidrug efflux pump subunit AcrB